MNNLLFVILLAFWKLDSFKFQFYLKHQHFPEFINRRKRTDVESKPSIKKVKKIESSPVSSPIRSATPDSQFGSYIGAELRLFEEHERDEAKMGIMQVLHSIKSRRRCMMPGNDGFAFN